MLRLENKAGVGLELHYEGVADPCRARTYPPTFIPPDAINMPGYALLASPTLFSGQTVKAAITARVGSVNCALFISYYGPDDHLIRLTGTQKKLQEGESCIFDWQTPDLDGAPIAQVGLELSSATRSEGTLSGNGHAYPRRPGLGGL